MNEQILSVRNVQKSYNSGSEVLKILRGINLTVNAGQSAAIMGASGCGKSTLLNLIGGLDHVNSGEIVACGVPVNTLNERKLTEYRSNIVGFVFQFHYLLKDFTAVENVMLPMVMAGTSRKIAREAAMEQLSQVGIAERHGHYPSQLSGGERQRAALARALINDPQLILADEPTGNLDDDHKNKVSHLIFNLVRERGKSLVLVTHAADLAMRADFQFTLKEGRLISQ